MNNATFTGNLTKDCRTSKSQAGTAMCFFTIAVNSGFGDRKHTDYVDCALFGKRAEGGLIQYLVKGTQVCVSGGVTLQSREYEGKTFTNMSLDLSELDLIGGAGKPQAPQAPPQQAPQSGVDPVDDGSGIPF